MYVPTHLHTDYSFLDCSSKISEIAKHLQTLSIPACAITDHSSISGAVEFSKSLKKVGIKPILGVEFDVTLYPSTDKTQRDYYHLLLLAKNKLGWKQLLKIVSRSNSPQSFYYKPRLSLEEIQQIIQEGEMGTSQLIAICGHLGSITSFDCFGESAKKIGNQPASLLSSFLVPDFKKNVGERFRQLREVFGHENVFGEVQLIDADNLPVSRVQGEIVREVCSQNNIRCVGTGDPHYLKIEDSFDHRALLCINLKTTLQQVERQILNDEDVSLGGFFRSNNYYIHSYEEMKGWNTEEELKNTLLVADMCENYSITSNPIIPSFPCPDNLSPIEYMTKLCREGWRNKESYIQQSIKECGISREEYGDRFRHELDVITKANLADYFLIVRDYIEYARSQNIMVGPARGSSAGCLIAYLLNIVQVDPLRYNLLFERFFNSARASSLPDIDTDMPSSKRDDVVKYLQNKYGDDKVKGISTFSRLQGRAILKDVLRVNEVCSFEEMNRITEYVEDEAKIADSLQEMRDDGIENPSIIRWCLENHSDKLKQWAYLNSEDEIEGPLAPYFNQACRLEGTKRNLSKHACGYCLSNEPLENVVPLVYDKTSGNQIIALDKKDCEAIGLVKFDLLSVSLLDKLDEVKRLLLK